MEDIYMNHERFPEPECKKQILPDKFTSTFAPVLCQLCTCFLPCSCTEHCFVLQFPQVLLC